MQGQKFKFFLTDDSGKSYYVEDNIVKKSSLPKSLEFAPDGWENMKINWERNANYFGVFRSFTLPLSFFYDGAFILNTLFFTKNIEEKVYLVICQQDLNIDKSSSEYLFYYKFLYKGEVDLSTFSKFDIEDGFKVTVNILEGGASKWLKSRQNTVYEIDCNNQQKNGEIAIRLHGINYFNKSNFSTFDYESDYMICDNSDWSYLFLPIVYINEEGESFGIYKGDQAASIVTYSKNNFPTSSFASSNNFFFKNEGTATVKITVTGMINLEVWADYPGYARLRCGFVRKNGTFISLYDQPTPPSSSRFVNILLNSTLFVPTNDCIFLIVDYYGYNSSGVPNNNRIKINVIENKINFVYSSKLDDTIIYAQRPKNLFAKLIPKLTDNEYNGISTLFNNNKNLAITSGNAIRNLNNATIKTHVQDFFNAINVQLNCGLGVDEKNKNIIIEEKAYFFNTKKVIHLGVAKSMKISLAKDYTFNSLKIGYPNQSNVTTINGKEEFNNTHQYQFSINKITKELNLVSPYRADGFGITQILKNSKGLEKQSNPGDNECFILEIDDLPTKDSRGISAYNVKKLPNTATITGLFAGNTAYNIGLSPKRLFRKHSNYIQGCLNGFYGQKITFQTTEQNQNLKTIVGSEVIEEKQDITVGDPFYFDKPQLFQPIVFEFDAVTPINMVELMAMDDTYCFSFIFNEILLYGFLIKPSIDISNNEAQQFTLLSAPINDLTKLI